MTPNLRGSLYMVASMAGFAVEDAFLKAAAQQVPVGEAILLMGLVGIAVFSAIALRAGEAPLPRAILSRTMAIRSGFEIAGRLFYALAIALTPISVASAILQASPLLVVLGAALIFGETVGLRRWVLILGGSQGAHAINMAMVAAAPEADLLKAQGAEGETWRQAFADRAGRVVGLAAETFNDGLRAYYFAFAAIGWFFSPLVFLARKWVSTAS